MNLLANKEYFISLPCTVCQIIKYPTYKKKVTNLKGNRKEVEQLISLRKFLQRNKFLFRKKKHFFHPIEKNVFESKKNLFIIVTFYYFTLRKNPFFY